ncbi:hypothetical protein PS2_030726 [Malus domestica]
MASKISQVVITTKAKNISTSTASGKSFDVKTRSKAKVVTIQRHHFQVGAVKGVRGASEARVHHQPRLIGGTGCGT